MELQLRTKRMDDIAEIGPANHLEYEKRQEKERIQRDTIPKGECIYFDEAYERGMKLLNLYLWQTDPAVWAPVTFPEWSDRLKDIESLIVSIDTEG